MERLLPSAGSMGISRWHGIWPISNSGPCKRSFIRTFARPDFFAFVAGIKAIRFSYEIVRVKSLTLLKHSFFKLQGEIVKRTFSAIMLLGLAVAVFQGVPANAQSTTPSIFEVVPTPNQNSINNQL